MVTRRAPSVVQAIAGAVTFIVVWLLLEAWVSDAPPSRRGWGAVAGGLAFGVTWYLLSQYGQQRGARGRASPGR